MKESYRKGVAIHPGPESCETSRKACHRSVDRGHCPLRGSYLSLRPLAVLGYPCPQPFLDQAQYPLVGDAVVDEFDQPFVRQIVEKAPNVAIENPVYLLPHDPNPERIQCIVLASPRAEIP
jgi:hypothetical protein